MLEQINNKSFDFYLKLGPFLGKREIHKEIGIPLYDDDDKVWIVALVDGKVTGFASRRGGLISDCYVVKEQRNKGIMFSILEAICTEKNLRATCTNMSKGVFKRIGFIETKKSINYTYMERKSA